MVLSELWQYRDLLAQLVRREIVVRYRHSVLGVAWALLNPLGLMLLFTFVFTRAVSLGAIKELDVPYPLWAYLGILPWTLFAAGLTGAVQSLAAHRDMVTKVYFPQQILPLTAVASALFDFVVASLVLVGLVIWCQATSDWTFVARPTLLALPVVLAVQLFLMLGLGLWLALANLWFRDVKYLFGVGIQMWMFLSNVLYPLPEDGSTAVRLVIACNPMVPVLSAWRGAVLDGQIPWSALAGSGAIGLFMTATGWWAYRACEGRFAERV